MGNPQQQLSPAHSIADQYRLVAKSWARLDGLARQAEEMRKPYLARLMKDLGEKPIAAAERDVTATQLWHDFITEMVNTRTQANIERAEMDFLMMKHQEAQRVPF